MRPSSTFSYKIHALVYSMDKLASDVLKKNSDVNFPQFLVILCAFENPGRTQRFVADWLQLTEATVSYMVTKLTRAGYMQTKLGANDSRSKAVYVTSKGEALVKKNYPLLEQAIQPHIEALPSKKVLELMSGVDAIHASINQINEGKC